MDDTSVLFREAEEDSAPEDVLKRLHKAIDEALSLEETVNQLSQDLNVANQQLNHLKNKILPDIMIEARSDEFTYNDWKLSLSSFISGSLPKDEEKRKIAIKWLEDHGAADIVKTDISVSFGRSEHEEATKLIVDLYDKGLTVDVESGVHAKTLQKFAKDCLENGDEIDLECLGLYSGKNVRIKRLDK